MNLGRSTRSGRRGPNRRSGCQSAGEVPAREAAGVETDGQETLLWGRVAREAPNALLAGVLVSRTEGKRPIARLLDGAASRSCGPRMARTA